MEEAGGKGSYYINPENINEMAQAIREVLENSEKRETLIREGIKHSLNFTDREIAKNLIQVYKSVVFNMKD